MIFRLYVLTKLDPIYLPNLRLIPLFSHFHECWHFSTIMVYWQASFQTHHQWFSKAMTHLRIVRYSWLKLQSFLFLSFHLVHSTHFLKNSTGLPSRLLPIAIRWPFSFGHLQILFLMMNFDCCVGFDSHRLRRWRSGRMHFAAFLQIRMLLWGLYWSCYKSNNLKCRKWLIIPKEKM